MPAQTTAKIVMASAKRLMELRHCCLNSRRIAEISVPAWPMPIHQTKLMMAKPQATGCVMAQMPTPLRNSHTTATRRTVATPPAMPNSPSQPSGVSTIRTILSVTVLKVSPSATTRNSPVAGSMAGSFVLTSLVAMATSTLGRRVLHRLCFKFGVEIQNSCDVTGARARILIGQHLVGALVGVQLGDLALRIVHIAERNRRSRAGLLAGGDHFAVADGAVFLVGRNA